MYDVVLILPPDKASQVRRLLQASGLDIPIISCHNSGIGRRTTLLYESLLVADYVVINNYSAWLNFRGMIPEDRFRCCNISNGLDTNVFRVMTPTKERKRKIVFTCTAGRLNPELGDVKGLSDVLKPLKVLMENKGWEVDYHIPVHTSRRSPQEMAEWYNTATHVVCASTSEGTPNFVLEGMACGCIPVTAPVGNMPEIIRNGYNGIFPTERSTLDFMIALDSTCRTNGTVLSQVGDSAAESASGWDWQVRVPHYHKLMIALASGDTPEAFSYVDHVW